MNVIQPVKTAFGWWVSFTDDKGFTNFHLITISFENKLVDKMAPCDLPPGVHSLVYSPPLKSGWDVMTFHD